MTEPLYIHEKVLNMTQTKVTAFYIFHKLKIRPFFDHFLSARHNFPMGTCRTRSYKNIQGHSGALKIKILAYYTIYLNENFWKNFCGGIFDKILRIFKISSSFKNIPDEYSRGESLDVTTEYIKINYLKFIISHDPSSK